MVTLSFESEMTNPPIAYVDPTMPPAKRAMVKAVELANGQRKLKTIHRLPSAATAVPPRPSADEMVRRTRIRFSYDRAALDAVPATGPLVVVANHPYGLVDGFAICWLMRQRRRDFKLLINSVLIQAPETREHLLPIDFAPTDEARAVNLASRAAARRLLADGGAVLVFPAGGISTAPDRWGRRPAMDWPWLPFAAQLQQQARCSVVPIHFAGQNSRAFQIASHFSQTVRLAMMTGEIVRRFGSRLDITIGSPIPPQELRPFEGRKALITELCRRTYALAGIDTTCPA
jgi:putative hemolysin